MPVPLRWRYKFERWRDSAGRAFRSERSAGRPRLCPACGTLVGSSATKCHQCGASLTFSLAAASRSLSALLPSESPVTYVILGLNVLLFGVSLLATMRASEGFNLLGGIDGRVLIRLGARQALFILGGQWWRLVMPIFLHGGILHILMNTWVLMDLGPQIEEVYGSARYLFLYVATGIFSFVVSSAWSVVRYGGGGIGVGASGSLMGLIGVMLAITSRRGGAYMQMVRGQIIRWLIYIFAFGILIAGVDNAAHLGGLASGFVLGKVMADRQPGGAEEVKRAQLLGWLSGLLVLVSFGFMLQNYFATSGAP